MNANGNGTPGFFEKQSCPVTGLPVMHRPQWAYANPDTDYRVKVSVLGARVILSQPSGYASLEDVKCAVGIIDRAVAEGIAPGSSYIQVEDYTRLKGVSFAGRKFFIDCRKSNPRISAILFCGVSPLFKLSIGLARHIYNTGFPALIAGDCAEGLGKARNMLRDMQALEGGQPPTHSALKANPEWNLRLEGFSVQYGVIDGRVIHGVSAGFLEERHVKPIIDMMAAVYAAMGSPEGSCYCLNEVSGVSGSTRKARQFYYDAMKEWFSTHPGFRMYIFSGAGRLVAAAIRMSSAFGSFTVRTTKDFDRALQMINCDRRPMPKSPPSSPGSKVETVGGEPFAPYVNELLRYLGTVDWEAEDNSSGRPADLSHPFLPVFDGIDLIKSDLGAVLKERNEAGRSLFREKQLSESIIDHIPAGVAFLDCDFILRKCNRAYARFIETYAVYSPEECLGMSYFEYLPGGREQVEEWYGRVRDTGMADTRHNFILTLEKEGKQVKTFWDRSIVPVLDVVGKVEGILVLTTDVTERKRAEEKAEKLKEQLRQAQKMESIGTLAGGIAHDFNNILSAILGYTELCLMDLANDSRLKANLEGVLGAGKRARKLVQQILAFSRQGNPEMAPFRIERVVRDALHLIRASFPATVDIRFQVKTDATVMGDSTQIHQVIMNLCTNAGQAMKDGKGVLTVDVADEKEGSDDLAGGRDGMLPGGRVRIRVGDTGQGMTREVIARIFDPYFTTKRKGHGTGLGLAVTHGIVKNHGGAITVESESGKGSAFTVFLPTVQQRPGSVSEGQALIPRGNERILLVDDEMSLVDFGKQMLENLGYSVTARTSSVEALEVFRMDPDRFDLVITDMTMPNMTGVDLSRRVMRIRPDMPVILSTGFSELITEGQAKALGIKAFISKPVLKVDLARTVREVLDSGGAGRRPGQPV